MTDHHTKLSEGALLSLLEDALESTDGRQDPYPFLTRIVAETEVLRRSKDQWFVLGYAIALEVLRATDFFKGGVHLSSRATSFTASV